MRYKNERYKKRGGGQRKARAACKLRGDELSSRDLKSDWWEWNNTKAMT